MGGLLSGQRFLDRQGIDDLLRDLSQDGYRVIGPRLNNGAIVFGDVASTDDLPASWTDEQRLAPTV